VTLELLLGDHDEYAYQREGLDYEDTFAPVIRLESLRILFAITATCRLVAHILDTTNAYIGSKIDKQIYMEIPQGIDHQIYELDDVCEILQSLMASSNPRIFGIRKSKYSLPLQASNRVLRIRVFL
jgi:hypothetical protein